MRRFSPLVLVFLLVVASGPLAAQAAPADSSLPFRPGQWGVDFGIGGGNVYRIGVTRFSSPTRAWVLDARVEGQYTREEQRTRPDSLGAVVEEYSRGGGSLSLLVGRRAYRRLGARAVRTLTVGATGGATHDQRVSGPYDFRSSGWHAGAEGALGGHYLVNSSLALGATVRIYARYEQFESRSFASAQRARGVRAGVGASDLVLSLFF